MKGCGKFLEKQLQEKFFEILKHYHRLLVLINEKSGLEKAKPVLVYENEESERVETILFSMFICRLKASDYAFFSKEVPIFGFIFNSKKLNGKDNKNLVEMFESSKSDKEIKGGLNFEFSLFKE